MYTLAEIQINHTRNAIANLQSAMELLERYKLEVEITLTILKDLKVGNETTGLLLEKDKQYLFHANCIGNDFREQKGDASTILPILYALDELNNDYLVG